MGLLGYCERVPGLLECFNISVVIGMSGGGAGLMGLLGYCERVSGLMECFNISVAIGMSGGGAGVAVIAVRNC